jgi:hypothetical protein
MFHQCSLTGLSKAKVHVIDAPKTPHGIIRKEKWTHSGLPILAEVIEAMAPSRRDTHITQWSECRRKRECYRTRNHNSHALKTTPLTDN